MSKFLLFSLILISFSCSNNADSSDAYGNFEAITLNVSAQSEGQLLTLHVEEGKNIGRGELVAIVDTAQLHLQRKQLEASLGTLPKKLRNTLAEIEVLENQKSNLIRERDRVKRLVEKKAATPQQLDDFNGNIEVLEKQILAVRSNTQTGNAAILSEKEPLLAQIALVNDRIKKSYVRSPAGGTVLTKLVEPGEIVRPGSPLFRLGQLDTMTLRFYATATDLQKVALGQKIEVLVDNGKKDFKKLTGEISWIAEQAEFTPKTIQTKEDRVNLVYAVKAKVLNSDGYLKIGMPAEVNFNLSSD